MQLIVIENQFESVISFECITNWRISITFIFNELYHRRWQIAIENNHQKPIAPLWGTTN